MVKLNAFLFIRFWAQNLRLNPAGFRFRPRDLRLGGTAYKPMAEEDEFGDLYADVGLENCSFNAPSLAPLRSQGVYEDLDDEEVLYGRTSPPSSQQQQQQERGPRAEVGGEFDFGDAGAEGDGQDGSDDKQCDAKEVSRGEWAYSENNAGDCVETSPREGLVEESEIKRVRSGGELVEENGESIHADQLGETVVEGKAGRDLCFMAAEPDDNEFQFGVENGSPQADDIPGIGAAPSGMASIPGLSMSLSGYDKVDEDGEGNEENWSPEGSGVQDLTPALGLAGVANQGLTDEEWDSDSEDDLQIVLNDDCHIYSNLDRGDGVFEEGSDDDGEDLVIVAGGDHPIENQEWGAEVQLPLEGAVSASGDKTLPADKSGDDRGQAGKGSLGVVNSVIPRLGYSNQHFHPHYPHYKYVRPGAVPVSGGVPNSSGGAQNQTRPPVSSGGIWGAGKSISTAGRGDWISSGGRGPVQRTAHSGIGMPPWSSATVGRAFQNGFEFTLPPNKTVFEIDIDAFEEKPWRQPGVDITDFFNFSLDEDSWKQYCRQLEQLRLEATMQSKIHVYESGRSEQEYDPDLPPELAAATGLHEAFGENIQNRLPDPGPSALPGRGRGLGRGRAQIPTGRAIQVEGGGVGERRPSVDFRRPRSHDSDAVIEIVLQDASEDDTTDPLKAPESANDGNEREESERGVAEIGREQKQVNLEYSLQTRHAESWERDSGSRKINSGGGMIPRTIHHGDGLLPLPPGPPIQCQSGSIAGPGMYPARLELQHFGRRSQLIKPYKVFSQVGDEHNNGSIRNQDIRGNRNDSCHKERLGDGMERKQSPELGCTMDDVERKPTPEIRCMIDVEQHPLDEIHVDLRSDDHNRPASEVKVEDDAGDGAIHSIKRQKLSSQNESQTTGAGYSHHLKTSKSGNSKAESGNSRDYSKGRANSRDYSKGRGSCEEEVSQYRPQKRVAKDGKKLQCEEETYLYQKNDYTWNGRQVDEKGISHQKVKENLKHHRVKADLYRHGDREEMYHRKAKEEIIDKHRERDDHMKTWQGKNEEVHIPREKDDESWRRNTLVKDDGLQHRNKRHDAERYEREEHLHLKKKKDDDDWRGRVDKEDMKRREREKHATAHQEKEDDSYLRRKKEDDLLRRERADKYENTREVRDREDFGREKHEEEEDYRRKKEEELRRRERPDKDQGMQDPREREDIMGREKHERDDDYLRRKEEDLRRRERSDKDQGIRDPREREDMGKEKHERDDDCLRRKEEELRRRERSDKDQGTRDLREREDMGREKHERDDDYMRRKEEDWRRRERVDKDDSVRDLREREDTSREKHERDEDHYFRRKEEESRRRSLFDDPRARKQRDDSWRRRERDDEHWRKQGFEEAHGRRDREDEKSMLPGRSRHHSEEKMWHGSDRDKVRGREEVIDKDRLKERRRHEEQRGKVKDQVDDTGRSRHHERDDIYSRMDRLSYEERGSRHDRAHLRYEHGHSGEEQKLYREKRTLDPAKGKSFDRNGSVSGLADDKVRHDQAASGRRRRTEDYYTMHQNKKVLARGSTDEESGSIWGGLTDRRTQSRTTPSDLSKRLHGQEVADRHALKMERVAADESASEDEPVKRGRSKLERWTSQKDKDNASMWENDASKHQKQPANQEEEEGMARKDEQISMNWSGAAETKRNLGKEQTYAKEEENHAADREEKEAVLDEPIHATDSKEADVDQSGNQQHCETVAKLEKRRERFKLPISSEKEFQKKVENEAFLENEIDEVKQERPTRKRRWGSS